LYRNVEDSLLLIDRTLEVMACPSDREEHLIQVPLVAGLGPLMPESIGIPLAELVAPPANRFITHRDDTGKRQLFDITIADAETEVEPDRVADDLDRESDGAYRA